MAQQSSADLTHLQDLLETALIEADRCDQAIAAHIATAIARLDDLKLLRQSRAR